MDSFSITIITIISVTFLSAFIKGRKKDRCLKKIDGYYVYVYNSKEKIIWGRSEIESNSIIIDFETAKKSDNKKFILYKDEFKNMQLIMRLHKYFDEKQKLKREKLYNKILKPGFISRFKRKISNIFATTKDAVTEIINLFIASAKTIGPMKVLGAQSKQIDKLKNDSLANITSNAYEPIWERYIGKCVEIEILEDKLINITGLLVEYSESYILIYDSIIEGIEQEEPHDLIISRNYGTIRHVLRV